MIDNRAVAVAARFFSGLSIRRTVQRCDFGISRWQRSSSGLASEVLGTFAYMAPEQIARKVNCASDQYALAVMACHLLTGKLPIQAATNEEYAHAHVHQRPRSPSQLNPQRINAPEVDAVILRALEKNPGKRFPTILEFARELQRVLTDVMKRNATAPTEPIDPAFADTLIYAKPQKARIPTSLLTLPPVAPDIPIIIDPPEYNEEQILDEILILFIAGRGIAQSFTDSNQVIFTTPEFQFIGLGRLLGIPIQVIIMAIIVALQTVATQLNTVFSEVSTAMK